MQTISTLYQHFLQYPYISTDSRKIKRHCIFFALKGDSFNGNHYADQALKKGAAYVVVDEKQYYKDDKAYILVNDALYTLQLLATYHRQQMPFPILGVTGSNGKTTTKELIAAVLRTRFHVHATEGNLNNHIGVPLTLLQLTSNHQFGIIEMGANHIGEIEQLCHIAQPDAGLITNIGKAHIEGFGSFEGVKQGKSEMYKYLAQQRKPAFVNRDNDILTELADTYNVDQITYGTDTLSLYQGQDVSTDATLAFRVSDRHYQSVYVQTQLVGSYNFENAMAASAIGLYYGVELSRIKTAIEAYTPHDNRSHFTATSENNIIQDMYNANPTSMKAAIDHFARMDASNKILILGDMLELGDMSDQEHQELITYIPQQEFRQIFLVGPCFQAALEKTSSQKIKAFEKTDDLIDYLQTYPLSSASILLKASRGIALEKVLPYV